MAIIKIFPSKDTTIYSQYPNLNSGIDEILDLSTNIDTSFIGNNDSSQRAEVCRVLIEFDSSSLSNVFSEKIQNSNWRSYLRVFLAKASSLPFDYTLYSYPISESWSMGSGRFDNIPQTTNGTSWNYKTSTSLWATTGSSFISSIEATQSFHTYSCQDIEMDVTNIVSQWISGSIPNYGFLIKHSSSIEFNTGSILELKFFSRDTHTIYPSQLEFRWADHTYTTGSVITNNKIAVSLGNNKGTYKQGTIQRFNVNVRDLYPVRQFTTSSIYLNNKILPSQSYWSIKDLHTEEVVVDFDERYTVLSSDGSTSFFNMNFQLEPERNYTVIIKTIIGSETIYFTNEKFNFKVIR